MRLLVEALIVGLVTGLVGSVVSLGIMYVDPKFSLKKYTFWPQVFISYFLTGLLLHLLFEFAGANGWYCRNGNACKALKR